MIASCNRRSVSVRDFDVSEYYYQMAIEYYPCGKNIGRIDDALTARAKAKEVWREELDCAKCEKGPVEVYFDPNSDCWFVCGVLPKNYLGGVANIIIQADGYILAVWHDK